MGWDREKAERLGDSYEDHYCVRCGRPFVSSGFAECECEDDER